MIPTRIRALLDSQFLSRVGNAQTAYWLVFGAPPVLSLIIVAIVRAATALGAAWLIAIGVVSLPLTVYGVVRVIGYWRRRHLRKLLTEIDEVWSPVTSEARALVVRHLAKLELEVPKANLWNAPLPPVPDAKVMQAAWFPRRGPVVDVVGRAWELGVAEKQDRVAAVNAAKVADLGDLNGRFARIKREIKGQL